MTPDSSRFCDVTVIVPAYQAEATIGRALASVAAQTLKPRAIVVVDDGSTDRTFETAEEQRPLLGGIELTVLKQKNAGAGAARNRAIMSAHSEYIAFLDSDDEWLPKKLARSMPYLEADNFVFVAHDSLEIDGSEVHRIECASRYRNASDAPFAGLYRRGFVDTSTVVARRLSVVSVGGFDETLPNAQDFDLWLKLLADPSRRFYVFGEVLSRYHRTPGSIMSHVDRRRSCCMTIANRHAPSLRAHPGSPLCSLWFRTVAVHAEAISAHRKNRNLMSALFTALSLPAAMAAATGTFFAGSRFQAMRGYRAGPRLLGILSWFWVCMAGALWAAQFADLVPRIPRLLSFVGAS